MTVSDAPPIFAFVDLDNSLFSSARKRPPGVAFQPAALLNNGEVVSYTSLRQRRLLDWLHLGATTIPVTARSVAALARVLLPFPGLAIASFGGVILDARRQPDPQWSARMQAVLAESGAPLAEACAELDSAIAARRIDAWVRPIDEFGQTQYLLIKHRAADAQALAALHAEVLLPWVVARPGWRTFQNDNNLVLLPPGLDKAHAVAHVMTGLRERHGEFLSIGIGDSLSDAGFLALCDYAMAPRDTQLSERLLIEPVLC